MRLRFPDFSLSATAAVVVALAGLGAAPLANAQSLQELYDAARAYDATYLADRIAARRHTTDAVTPGPARSLPPA